MFLRNDSNVLSFAAFFLTVLFGRIFLVILLATMTKQLVEKTHFCLLVFEI